MKMALNLCDPPPQTYNPKLNHEENISQSPIMGQPRIYLMSTPQNCQGQQIQGKSEKLSQLKRSLRRPDN